MTFDWLNSSAAAPYRATIISAANANGVDPSVLANQIGAESSFNPKAVSSTGAIGLAQILPSTAANPGYGVAPVDPTDPTASINFAAQYTNARGGYNAQGLAAYSGGSYSPATVSGIMGGASSGSSDAASSDTTSPITQVSALGTMFQNLEQRFLGADTTGSTASSGSSTLSNLQEFFVRVSVAIVGLAVIIVALTYFHSSVSQKLSA